MKTALTCEAVQAQLRELVEGQLAADERSACVSHIRGCAACRASFDRRKSLVSLMNQTLGQMQIGPAFEERAGKRLANLDLEINALRTPSGGQNMLPPESVNVQKLPLPWAQTDADDPDHEVAPALTGADERSTLQRLGGAPWWGVSLALHVLAILLASLVTMTIGTLDVQDDIVIITNIERALQAKAEEQEKKPELRDVLESKKDIEATDRESTTPSNIAVAPEIMAQAQLSDHFETINPDRPDTQSAFGNPDAHLFHSVAGNDEPEGGGGAGGTDLLNDLIGTGGPSSRGTGGGWGGGNGTGTGIGNGSGHGSFGQRNGGGRRLLVMRHGGGKATESAVDKGLEWLARNQEADGRWDNVKHGGKHNGPTGDVAMTGYAVLAFLGAGHSERVGKYKDNVAKGVAYLIENQGKGHPGRWVPLNYTNGIATMAISEAAAMGRVMKTREAAQKAVDGVDDAQIRRGNDSDREAWDYGPKGGTNDSSIMAWNILGLKSAKVAGLKVDPATFDGAIRWIDAGQDLGNLKPGEPAPTEWVGGAMAYRGTCAAVVKGQGSMAVTAAAALCRLHFGGNGLDHPGVTGPCNMMMKHLPKNWPYNLYYGYYGTLVMFQKGGEHWKSWNEAMKKTLLDAQRKGGAEDGSWDGASTACDESRVMTTALAVMSLEVYYRYLPMFREGGGK